MTLKFKTEADYERWLAQARRGKGAQIQMPAPVVVPMVQKPKWNALFEDSLRRYPVVTTTLAKKPAPPQRPRRCLPWRRWLLRGLEHVAIGATVAVFYAVGVAWAVLRPFVMLTAGWFTLCFAFEMVLRLGR